MPSKIFFAGKREITFVQASQSCILVGQVVIPASRHLFKATISDCRSLAGKNVARTGGPPGNNEFAAGDDFLPSPQRMLLF